MYHDKLIIANNEKGSLISTFIEKFNCKKTLFEESIHLNNEEKELKVILINKISKNNLILILDYPKSLKIALEKELLMELPGKDRIPTLKEFAVFIEELANKTVTKKQLREYLGIDSAKFENLLVDFEVSSTKKRATPTMKKAWTKFKNIIVD